MIQYSPTAQPGHSRDLPHPVRRGITALAEFVLLIALPQLVPSQHLIAQAGDRPNIVLIMADDMGYSDIGCYGGEIKTPHLDALAAGGIRFTQFYNTGRCCPTRASLMTGLYPHAAGLGHMVYADRGPGYHPYLNRQCVTIAEVLGQAGYRTMMTGKWHVGHQPGQWPTDRGFAHFYGIHIHVDSYWKVLRGCPVYHNGELAIGPTAEPENTLNPDQEFYTTDVFADWSLKFLDEAAEDQRPFFLYTAFNSPHWPLEAPDENIANYKGRYAQGWDRLRAEKLARMKQLGLVHPATELSPSQCPEWSSLGENEQRELQFRREIYAAQIERMDQNIGRIVARLRELGQLDNTLLLFLSDNGCCAEGGMFGYQWGKNGIGNFRKWRKQSGRSSSTGEAWSNASNTPFRMHKRWVHEGGIATPLIVHWPAVVGKGGSLCRQTGHVIDILSTCLDVAQASYPAESAGQAIKPTPGRSLLPYFRDPARHDDRALFWEHETHSAIRVGDWKLVTLNGTDEEAWELYDMSRVRTETDNVAEAHPDRVARMKAEWTAWATRANVLPWPQDRGKRQPKPLFADPHYNGSCDPEIVWNPAEREWFIYYTARRATREAGTYVGTPLGVISSPDLVRWRFRGYCSFDGKKGQPDNEDTHWAPGILIAGEQLHMFATYKASAQPPWGGHGVIRHYVAPLDNPIDGWQLADAPEFNQPDPIDVSLLRFGDQYRAYYRVGKGGGIQWASSPDLSTWTNHGKCPGDANASPAERGFGYQEAPYVFRWRGRYWMLTDPHEGLAVYHSADGVTWTRQPRILREPGGGPADATRARHPSVAVIGDRAFVFYHTEPNRPYPSPPAEQRTPHQKMSFLQMAELRIEDGKLVCDRDAKIDLATLEK